MLKNSKGIKGYVPTWSIYFICTPLVIDAVINGEMNFEFITLGSAWIFAGAMILIGLWRSVVAEKVEFIQAFIVAILIVTQLTYIILALNIDHLDLYVTLLYVFIPLIFIYKIDQVVSVLKKF